MRIHNGVLAGLFAAVCSCQGAVAASCVQQVEQVAQATGLMKGLPNIPGLSQNRANSDNAADEPGGSRGTASGGYSSGNYSRGQGAETPLSDNSSFPDNPSPSDNSAAGSSSAANSNSATRHGNAQALLQSAQTKGTQGDEQGCLAQLAQAKDLLFGKK